MPIASAKRLRAVLCIAGWIASLAASARASLLNSILAPDGNLTVYAYSPATGTQNGSFSVPFISGSLPSGIAVGPDQNIYLAMKDNGNINEFNGTTGGLIRTFASGTANHISRPEGIAFGPDGNLYLSNPTSDSIYVFDGSNGAFLRSMPLNLAEPRQIAFAPNGALYIAGYLNQRIDRINPDTGQDLGLMGPTIDSLSGVALGNGKLYAMSGGFNPTLYLLDPSSGEILKSVTDNAHLSSARGLLVGSDGDVYVASMGNFSIVRYTADGSFDRVFVAQSAGLPQFQYLAESVPEPSRLGLFILGIMPLLRRSRSRAACVGPAAVREVGVAW